MSDYLLVHGGFQGGWVWDAVVERLTNAGHRPRVMDQLSSSDPCSSSGDLSADADKVRRALDAADEPVVLVGHSYGGMVITECADHPNVRHSVYLTALWPQQGQSALNLFGDALPPVIVPGEDGVTMHLVEDFTLVWKAMCPDLDRAAAQEMFRRCVPQTTASFTTPSTAPERTHPASYIIATEESDQSVAAQEARAARADYVVRMPAAHMVQLSRPDELAEILGQI